MEVQAIPIGHIQPSPMNPRKTFEQEDLQELAQSIKEQGLLQPITVRPINSSDTDPFAASHYEIVCGERRYRAMCMIADEGYKVPCLVRVMSDAEAYDAMITENLQRKDVDPVEEAFAFGKLRERGDTTEEIAARFGKSQRFVSDRIKLNSLIPELLMMVKDEKLAISAAMIVCKLDEDAQRKFLERHQNYSYIGKEMAARYLNEIFQYIRQSAWSKNGQDDFEGSCGIKCADCPLNTANTGCIFYEMKADDDTARCISKVKFLEKKMSYMMSVVDAHADNIIKVGEPLEYGKIAIVSDFSYCYDKEGANRFVEQLKAKGYEVFERGNLFAGYSRYNNDDERLQQKIENHEVCRCLTIVSYYSGVDIEERCYEIRKDAEGVDNATIQEGVTATQLAEKYKKASDKCKQEKETALSVLFTYSATTLSSAELQYFEMVSIIAYMLRDCCYEFRSLLMGTGSRLPMDAYFEYVSSHTEDHPKIMREWLRHELSSTDSGYTIYASKVKEYVAERWNTEGLAKVVDEFNTNHEKKTKKIADKLDAMGYTVEGKKK